MLSLCYPARYVQYPALDKCDTGGDGCGMRYVLLASVLVMGCGEVAMFPPVDFRADLSVTGVEAGRPDLVTPSVDMAFDAAFTKRCYPDRGDSGELLLPGSPCQEWNDGACSRALMCAFESGDHQALCLSVAVDDGGPSFRCCQYVTAFPGTPHFMILRDCGTGLECVTNC